MKRLLSIAAHTKVCIIDFCNARFSLKAGQKVWVNLKSDQSLNRRYSVIKGFAVYGIIYKDHPVGWHHFSNGLFYGFGYHSDGVAIVTTKKWHYHPALVFEKLRLKLPEKLSKRLRLENGH